MKSKPSTDLKTDCFPCAEEAGRFDSAALAAWLATVSLVLIVIRAALSLGAWREHKKKNGAVRAQITTLSAFGVESVSSETARSKRLANY